MLFGKLLNRPPLPELPLFGYADTKMQAVLVRHLGHADRRSLALFTSENLAAQLSGNELSGVRILMLGTRERLASYLRRSGAKLVSIDPERFYSEPYTISERRLDCPIGVADAIAALEAPPDADQATTLATPRPTSTFR